MKAPARLLLAASVTMMVAANSPGGAVAAESEAPVQDLPQVRASGLVTAANWARRPDTYVLQIMIDSSAFASRRANAAVVPAAPVAPVATAGARPDPERGDRGSFFIGNTIANLRGLDPVFCGRTLTLVNGRRVADGQPTPAPATPVPAVPTTAAPAVPPSVNQPYPPRIKDGRVEVWLLKADGTQILPVTYSCDKGPRRSPTESPDVEVRYEFPLAGGEQAVAAAIRIGDSYYIEKLRPPVPKPAAL
jgi:hypothetical protein